MIPPRDVLLWLTVILPVIFLVVVAGVIGLLGLGFRDDGRDYAKRVCQAVLLAACALMAGRAPNLSGMLTSASNGGQPRQSS
jgi:hypothetical protein